MVAPYVRDVLDLLMLEDASSNGLDGRSSTASLAVHSWRRRRWRRQRARSVQCPLPSASPHKQTNPLLFTWMGVFIHLEDPDLFIEAST
jgi:hypothetical protein